MVRSYRNNQLRWVPGEAVERFGQVSFKVKLSDGSTRRCHVDQLRKRSKPSREVGSSGPVETSQDQNDTDSASSVSEEGSERELAMPVATSAISTSISPTVPSLSMTLSESISPATLST